MLNSGRITFGVLYRYQTGADPCAELIGLFSRAQQFCLQYSLCYKFSGGFCNDQFHVEISTGFLLTYIYVCMCVCVYNYLS